MAEEAVVAVVAVNGDLEEAAVVSPAVEADAADAGVEDWLNINSAVVSGILAIALRIQTEKHIANNTRVNTLVVHSGCLCVHA